MGGGSVDVLIVRQLIALTIESPVILTTVRAHGIQGKRAPAGIPAGAERKGVIAVRQHRAAVQRQQAIQPILVAQLAKIALPAGSFNLAASGHNIVLCHAGL